MSSAPPDSAAGLTSDEARQLLAAHGANAVQDVVQHPINRALGKLWAPVPWMLEAAVLLQLALGEYVEASAVAFLQQRHPEKRGGWLPSFLCVSDKRVCRSVHERSSSPTLLLVIQTKNASVT
jgi:hypothetical protein